MFFIVIVALYITGGRSAFLGMCCGLALLVICSKSNYRFLAIAGCAIIYLMVTFLSEYIPLFNRQESLGDAYLVRHNIWKEAFDIFLNHPFLGIGIGNYRNYIAAYSQGGFYLIDNEIVYYGTESGYLNILVESGIFGLILSLCFVIKPLIAAFRSRPTGLDRNIYFLMAAVVSWGVSFSSLYTLSDKRILILLATLLCLLIVNSSKKKAVTHDRKAAKYFL